MGLPLWMQYWQDIPPNVHAAGQHDQAPRISSRD